MKEQIKICTDSQAAVAATAASETKSLQMADCIEKLTVLSEVNQVIMMWVPGYSGIQQNETVDGLAREGAWSRSIGPEPFLPLSLSRFKSKTQMFRLLNCLDTQLGSFHDQDFFSLH